MDRRFTVFSNGVGGELLLVTLFFVGFFALYFSPVWAAGAVLAPGDAAISYFPLFDQPWAQISEHLLLGYPLEADLQVQANYPLKLLMPSYNAFVISAYVAMAVGTYAFLSAYAESRLGALLGAIVASSGGFMVAHLGHATIIHAACWIPWLLWTIHCGREGLRWPAVTVGSTVVCLSLLGGHPQISIIGFSFSGAFWIFVCVLAKVERRPLKGVVIHGACIFTLGLMLSAISTVPFGELAAQGVRTGWSLADFDTFSNSTRTLLLGFFPAIFGTFPTAAYGPYTGPWNLTELAFYAGVGPLVLAGIGLLANRRNPHVWFWAGIAVLSILISMGAATPVGRLIFHLPVVGTFRAQGRYGYIFILAIATLLAFAVGAFRRGKVRIRYVALSGVAVVIAMAYGLRVILHIYPILGAHPSDIAGDAVASMLRNPAVIVPLSLVVVSILLSLLWTRWRQGPVTALMGLLVAADLASFGMFYEWRFTGLPPEMLEMSAATRSQVDAVRRSGTRVLPLEDSQLVYGPFSPQVNVSFGVPLAVNYGPMLPARAQRFAQLDPTGHPHFDVTRSPLPDIMAVGWFARSPGGALFDNVVLSRGCGGPPTADMVAYAVPANIRAARIRLVSHMACSTGAAQGAEVATMRWRGKTGVSNASLRAGIDTSEWAIDRPGLVVNHKRAQVSASFDAPGAPGHDYVTQVTLDDGRDITLDELSIELRGQGDLSLRVRSVELVDSHGHTTPLAPQRAGMTLDISNPAVSLARRDVQPPLQWSVCQALVLSKDAIQAVLSGGFLPNGQVFDPHKVALLEKLPLNGLANCDRPAVITEVTRRAGRFTATVESGGAGFLVVSESWYPGWIARVDGTKATVLPVDGLIQGVAIPAGKHTVELIFRPMSFIIGLILTLVAIILLLAPFAWKRIKRNNYSGDR